MCISAHAKVCISESVSVCCAHTTRERVYMFMLFHAYLCMCTCHAREHTWVCVACVYEFVYEHLYVHTL
jgi:hypothetical protein